MEPLNLINKALKEIEVARLNERINLPENPWRKQKSVTSSIPSTRR